MGSALGIEKVAAKRTGLSLDEYRACRSAGLKWCTRCKNWQPVSTFGADGSRGDGLASSCFASRDSGAVGKPGARVRRLKASMGLAWCRGCAEWLPLTGISQGACRQHRAAYARAWYAGNPEQTRLRKNARKRGLAAIPAWWAAARRREFGGLCAYGCGSPGITWDHIWPVSRGGESMPGNLAPACGSCNSSKKARDPRPWIERGLAASPEVWLDILMLAIETCCDDWEELYEAEAA